MKEVNTLTKIDVISGFLGAGKTTFIKKLLSEALKGEQVVLIENEFGEIGIDGGFLKDCGIEIREMSQGCICCSLVGDFGKALQEVIKEYAPDRIIIEPSGVGKLSDVMKAVNTAASAFDVELNSAVTMVDANKCKLYMKNFGEFFNNQIEYAGTIVLSRTDVVAADKVSADVELLRTINSKAEIITTPVEKLSGAKLLEIMEKHDNTMEELLEEAKKAAESHHHHHHHDDEHECCHEHHHEHECCHGHHHEDEECCHHNDEHECHEHHHEDGECCHEHHHEHDEHCSCGCHDHHHHHGHDADEVFESWGKENVKPMSKKELFEILEELSDGNAYGTVLRSKGMVEATDKDGWYYFDLVPGEYEIRDGEADYTGKVCVIGAGLDREKLSESFK